MIFLTLDESYRPFIEQKMAELDSEVYNKRNFDLFYSLDNETVACIDKNEVIAFCGLASIDGVFKVCHTWCEKSKRGREAYAKGIDMIINSFQPLGFAGGALKLNKIRRIINAQSN